MLTAECSLQQCGLMQQLASGEALEAQHRCIIHDVSFAAQDQVRKDLAGGGGMHHAMAAEAVGTEKSGYAGYRAENGVMVGRHLIESRPRALGIHRQVFKSGNTVSSASEDLLNERVLKCGLESGRFLRIIPR